MAARAQKSEAHTQTHIDWVIVFGLSEPHEAEAVWGMSFLALTFALFDDPISETMSMRVVVARNHLGV